jgi:proteasome lid subunit RPN8/RPN11
VIFVHNHPSGDPAPSQEDQEITRRLKETGDTGAGSHRPGARALLSFSDKDML